MQALRFFECCKMCEIKEDCFSHMKTPPKCSVARNSTSKQQTKVEICLDYQKYHSCIGDPKKFGSHLRCEEVACKANI